MNDRFWVPILVLLLVSLPGRVSAQQPTPWHDPSPHTVQLVTVDGNVKLEVLDWGGSGRPLVLLAGLGNTAHVFDRLGPKLTVHYHVIGITRRGFGGSSAPTTGYDPKRLGDDVVAVLDALRITDPVLAGHSIAGEELSAISKYHPGRAKALIYLDAGGSYALYNPKHGDYAPALAELRDDLSMLQKNLYDDGIVTPLLAIFSYPSAPNSGQTSDPAKLAAYRAQEASRMKAQIAIFRDQPHAKVIVIPNATHYIFLSREEEVIAQIVDFVNNRRLGAMQSEK
jgi:pimeloyl-ACP methyl ester carboxylesterase